MLHLVIWASSAPMAAHEMCWSFDDGIPCHLRLARADEGRCGKFNKWKLMVLSRRKLHPGRWKPNMKPTNHPFGKEHDLPNIHDYVPCWSWRVYCWLLMAEIRWSPVEVGSLSTIIYMVSYIPGGWLWDFWTINSRKPTKLLPPKKDSGFWNIYISSFNIKRGSIGWLVAVNSCSNCVGESCRFVPYHTSTGKTSRR